MNKEIISLLGADAKQILQTLTDDIQYAVDSLQAKSINNKTIAEVLRYLAYNKLAFGNTLDTRMLVDKFSENLSSSIRTIPLKKERPGVFAYYNTNSGVVSVSKRLKIEQMLTLNNFNRRVKKCRARSILMHELDHCATTTKEVMPAEDAIADWAYKFSKNINIDELKEEIKNGAIKKCGIATLKNQVEQGFKTQLGLDALNEGIAVYKQHKYDAVADGAFVPKKKGTTYDFYESIAKHIVNIISEKELIRNHQVGNYAKIRELYEKETGCDLNTIVGALENFSYIYRKNQIEKYDVVSEISSNIRDFMTCVEVKKARQEIEEYYL